MMNSARMVCNTLLIPSQTQLMQRQQIRPPRYVTVYVHVTVIVAVSVTVAVSVNVLRTLCGVHRLLQ